MTVIVAAYAFAAVTFAVLAAFNADPAELRLGALLFAVCLVAARTETIIGSISLTGSFVPILVTAIIAPPMAGFVAFADATGSFVHHRSRIANASAFSIAASVGALAASNTSADTLLGFLGQTLVATMAFLTVNVTLVILYMLSARAATLSEMVPTAGASIVATSALLSPVVALIAWGSTHAAAWISVVTLVPLIAVQYFNGLYHRKVQLTEELAEKAQILARTNLQFAAAMVRALDTRDAYTAGHSAAVAVYTRDIAREMGFDDETVRLAHLAGLLHDIGKIGVPGRVLNKQSPLDDEEYELMKTHAAMGAEILGEVDLYKDIAILVRYHHERIDGRGYPDRLEGEAIPAISRMISVADTYSAMTTDRPYRDGMPTEKAMSILQECRGTQLDADFTNAFLRILIVADADYQRGKQTDFEVEVAKHQALSQVEAEAVRIDAPTPAGPQAPAAPEVPMLPAAVDGELVEVELEREAA